MKKGNEVEFQASIIILVLAIGLLVFVAYRYTQLPDQTQSITVQRDTKTAEALALLVARVDTVQANAYALEKLVNSLHQELDQAQHHFAGLRKELQLNREKKMQVELILKSLQPIPVRISEAHPKPLDPKLVKKVKGQLKEFSK